MSPPAALAAPIVTFDAGQTLVELDLDFLVRRLGERGLAATPGALAAALAPAWRHHDALVAAGARHPWHAFMTELLAGAGIAEAARAPTVAWLWDEQPRRNLWRHPIAGMGALARDLAARGVRVGVISNSEGGVADLLAEVGLADAFAAIVDSGRVGVAKPDPRIFAIADAQLGGGEARARVHVGDSWAADVVGARDAGWTPVWFGPGAREGEGALVARDADALARVLATCLSDHS